MTSREVEIRDKIARLDPAGFQNLSQELLTQHYGYDKPTYRGSAAHSAATAPGTPDAIWLLPHGKFAYLECGHYSDRTEAKRKIEADIKKCLEAEREELDSGQLVKIAIAYSCRRLSSSDLNELNNIDERVDLVGLDEMAMLLARRYPNLAREHLDVEVGTGQIMSPEDFEVAVEKNSFASTLKIDLLGRDKEVDELLSALEGNQFVLAHGRPGYGKTRLCLEVLRRYAGNSGAHPFVIQSNKMPIWDDLANDIPKKAPSIILLDDANELSGLGGFASFVSDRDNVKVLMTVRNYAVEYVKSTVAKFCKPYSYEVGPLEEEAALSVVENGFGIAKGRASADIIRLSRGNMRLACAAAEVAKERGIEVFSTMPSLIEACYEDKVSSLDGDVKKAATIVSVLGPHRLEENVDLEKLLVRLEVSHDIYVEACAALCRDELVDVCQNMVAVAPGEQVLRDYLLYWAFVAEKILSLPDVDVLGCGRSRCSEIVAILVNNFYSEELISALGAQLDGVWAFASDEKRWEMIPKYHFLLGEKGLDYIFDAIEGCESGSQDYLACQLNKNARSYLPESRVLASLVPFLHGSRFSDPEELFFMALEKDILPPMEAKTVLTTTMCFNEESYSDGFQYENEVIEHLIGCFRKTKASRYGVLFVCYAEALLSATYDGPTTMEGNRVTFIHGNHVYTEALASLRKHTIVSLMELRSSPELSHLCDSVITGLRGIPGDGGPGRLWKTTLETAYGEYVSRIESIDEYSLPGFAVLEKELISQGIIGEEGLAFLGVSVEMRIAALIFSDAFSVSGLSEELARSVESANSLELTGAISLVCSTSLQGGKGIPYWTLRDIVDLGADILSESAEATVLSGVPSFAVSDELLIRWMDALGIEQIRELVLRRQTNEIPGWLSRVDRVRFKKYGASFELARDIEEGASAYGEIIPYEMAMGVDSASSGFFVRYASSILRMIEKGSAVLRNLLPSDIDNTAQSMFASRPEVLSLTEKVMIALVNGRDTYWDEGILRFVILRDDRFLEKAMPALMESEAIYAMEHLGEAVWKEGSGEVATDRVWKAMAKCETIVLGMMKSVALKHFLDYAIEYHGEAVVSWLASRSVRDGILVEYLPDVAMGLPANLRVEYVVLLCRSGISPEELQKVPMYMSLFDSSWSGSEIPFIQRKVDFINKVLEGLPGIAFIKHRMVLEEESALMKKRMEIAEVREFLNPF